MGDYVRKIFLVMLMLTPVAMMAQATHKIPDGKIPDGKAIDAEAKKLMAESHANGMAVAVIDHGQVKYVQSYGIRDAKGDPLQTDTVMYAASLTKAVFAYTVMTLVDQGRIKLDVPIRDDLDKPLPEYDPEKIFAGKYGPYQDLASDPRWEKITPRMCLTHSTGFNNFWFLEPDQKLRIHFEPGTRFSYSGEGFSLLQFVIENGKKSQGLGLDLGTLTGNIFARLGMTRTSLMTTNRPDFAAGDGGWADGWNDKGEAQPHSKRSKVRVAGSMSTTITDFSKFAAALVRGEGLRATSRSEMLKPSLHITTVTEFPVFGADLPVARQRKDLYAGLGVVVFEGPQGPGYFKGGHDEQTGNTMVCLEKSERCVVILSNDVRAEIGYPEMVKFILGETGVPYDWEYGDQAGKS
jgi:CubicO group peptidase (beta-lactamase class C family)